MAPKPIVELRDGEVVIRKPTDIKLNRCPIGAIIVSSGFRLGYLEEKIRELFPEASIKKLDQKLEVRNWPHPNDYVGASTWHPPRALMSIGKTVRLEFDLPNRKQIGNLRNGLLSMPKITERRKRGPWRCKVESEPRGKEFRIFVRNVSATKRHLESLEIRQMKEKGYSRRYDQTNPGRVRTSAGITEGRRAKLPKVNRNFLKRRRTNG